MLQKGLQEFFELFENKTEKKSEALDGFIRERLLKHSH